MRRAGPRFTDTALLPRDERPGARSATRTRLRSHEQFSDTPTPVEHEYADVTADAVTTRWIGDRLDQHYAISVLAQHRKQPAHRAS
jgi:hypothetical protein